MIDFNQVLANNWSPDYHRMDLPVPANAWKFGLNVLDWDGAFTKRIRKYGTKDLTIPFQYIEAIPDWIKAANWEEISGVMGRFEPLNVYSNSGAQDFSITLIYVAEALNSGAGVTTKWTLGNIEKYIKRLQAMTFPIYDGNYGPPPKLLFNIGNIFHNIPIIIKSVTLSTEDSPFHVQSGLPIKRKVILECRVSYPMWQGISGIKIFTAYEGGSGKKGTEIFAYESLDDKFLPGKRQKGSGRSPFTVRL